MQFCFTNELQLQHYYISVYCLTLPHRSGDFGHYVCTLSDDSLLAGWIWTYALLLRKLLPTSSASKYKYLLLAEIQDTRTSIYQCHSRLSASSRRTPRLSKQTVASITLVMACYHWHCFRSICQMAAPFKMPQSSMFQ